MCQYSIFLVEINVIAILCGKECFHGLSGPLKAREKHIEVFVHLNT